MFRFKITAVISVMTAAAVVCHEHPAHALPSAAQFLSEIGWAAEDQQRVLNGEFVTHDASATSENDLTLSIAFLVKTSPADLSEQIIAGNIVGADPQVVASGELNSGGDLADLAGLEVDADTLQAFVDARPGEALNLSAGEIAEWNALYGAGAQAKLAQLRQMLLARFQAYRTSGLAGIAPYDRDGRSTNVEDELRSASNALSLLRKYLPD